MQERVYIGATAGRDYPGDWRTISKKIMEPFAPIEIKEYPYGYDFVLDYYPPQIETLMQRLRDNGLESRHRVERRYTRKELLAAEYLVLDFRLQVRSRGESLQSHLEPVCPHCGFQQRFYHYETLQIRDKPNGYCMAFVDYHAEVMSQALAHALSSIEPTGITLIPVGGSEPADWYGWRCDHVLPPLQIPPTRLPTFHTRTKQCKPNHGFDKFFSEMFYDRSSFDARDFNYTYEFFGDGPTGGHNRMVISQRVYRLLIELGKGRHWMCEPVRLID